MPTKHHFSSNFWEDSYVIFFLIICLIGINWLKKITEKPGIDVELGTQCHVAAVKY